MTKSGWLIQTRLLQPDRLFKMNPECMLQIKSICLSYQIRWVIIAHAGSFTVSLHFNSITIDNPSASPLPTVKQFSYHHCHKGKSITYLDTYVRYLYVVTFGCLYCIQNNTWACKSPTERWAVTVKTCATLFHIVMTTTEAIATENLLKTQPKENDKCHSAYVAMRS